MSLTHFDILEFDVILRLAQHAYKAFKYVSVFTKFILKI